MAFERYNNGNSDKTERSSLVVYKDDSFGLTFFLAGVAVRDVLFTGIFCTFSLIADVLTRSGVLPPDPKNPRVVDRKVPGVIVGLTLLLTSNPDLSNQLLANFLGEPLPPADPSARTVQLAIGAFSMITAFLDIRWRDRFDG